MKFPDGVGEGQEAIGGAVPVEGSGNAKLEVTFLPEGLRWIPFTKGDYWVLKVDPAYQTALVGEPERKYLWLLHRDSVIEAGKREEFLGVARGLGYDLAELIETPHTGRPTA